VKNIPSTDLATIERLWNQFSGGKFGYSVQKVSCCIYIFMCIVILIVLMELCSHLIFVFDFVHFCKTNQSIEKMESIQK
jgi:hypothetical protein